MTEVQRIANKYKLSEKTATGVIDAYEYFISIFKVNLTIDSYIDNIIRLYKK